MCRPSPVAKKAIIKEIKENGKQKSLDGKNVPTLKFRSTRSNSLPSIFCPGVNQLRGKNVNMYYTELFLLTYKYLRSQR